MHDWNELYLVCFLFIGLASKFIKSDSSIIRWFVELSYPIYIIHIIPVTMMSALFYHVGLSQFSMLLLAVISGFFICVILYYVFIKFTPLNWLINGYSKSPLKIKFLGFWHFLTPIKIKNFNVWENIFHSILYFNF